MTGFPQPNCHPVCTPSRRQATLRNRPRHRSPPKSRPRRSAAPDRRTPQLERAARRDGRIKAMPDFGVGSGEATSLGLRILAVPPYGTSPVYRNPGSQRKAQAPVRHGDILLRRRAVDPDIPKFELAQLRQQSPVASAPIPGHDEFRQPAEPKTENGAKTAGARRARSFRAPMRCRTSLAFSAGQTLRARPPWRCPARVQVFRPQDDVLRALGYIPIHVRIPFTGIIVWHRNHPPAVGDLRAKPLSAKGLEIYTH